MKSLLKQLLPPMSYALEAPRLDAELEGKRTVFYSLKKVLSVPITVLPLILHKTYFPIGSVF